MVMISAPCLVNDMSRSAGSLYPRSVSLKAGEMRSVRGFLARVSSGRKRSTGVIIFMPLGYRG